MMKTLVFYFHGYGSSPFSDKVDRMRAAGFHVVALPIHPDPEIALPYLSGQMDLILCDYAEDDINVVCVGTSLGAWYAAEMANEFHMHAVLINPSIAPSVSLMKYSDIDPTIPGKYKDMIFSDNAKFFIAKDDEVLDFEPYEDRLKLHDVTWVDNATHRFNGPEYNMVIDYIKNLSR